MTNPANAFARSLSDISSDSEEYELNAESRVGKDGAVRQEQPVLIQLTQTLACNIIHGWPGSTNSTLNLSIMNTFK